MAGMDFLWPTMLWLLLIVPALVLAYVLLLRKKKKLAVRYGGQGRMWQQPYAEARPRAASALASVWLCATSTFRSVSSRTDLPM